MNNNKGWTGSGCNEVFTMTWSSLLWGGGGGSLTTWAVPAALCKEVEQVALDPAINGRFGG